jgi:hypothetical protein
LCGRILFCIRIPPLPPMRYKIRGSSFAAGISCNTAKMQYIRSFWVLITNNFYMRVSFRWKSAAHTHGREHARTCASGGRARACERAHTRTHAHTRARTRTRTRACAHPCGLPVEFCIVSLPDPMYICIPIEKQRQRGGALGRHPCLGGWRTGERHLCQ